jgi:hypothetical protein
MFVVSDLFVAKNAFGRSSAKGRGWLRIFVGRVNRNQRLHIRSNSEAQYIVPERETWRGIYDPQQWWHSRALGAAMFVVSDLFVAKNAFGKSSAKGRGFISGAIARPSTLFRREKLGGGYMTPNHLAAPRVVDRPDGMVALASPGRCYVCCKRSLCREECLWQISYPEQ